MPIHAVRAETSSALWQSFTGAFLGEVAGCPGPGGFPARAWLTHRVQRDRLWHDAAARGLKGWLDPPVAFFSDLPRLFGLERRPTGLVERQILLDRLAARHAAGRPLGGDPAPRPASGSFDRPGLGRAVDHVLGELLPEAVSPDRLEAALATLPADDFARSRNQWLVTVLRDYLAELDRLERYDPRAVHAHIADRIAAGDLPRALAGARRLHIYGLATTRTRIHLLHALAAQADVEVVLYLLDPPRDGPDEWQDLGLAGHPLTLPDPHALTPPTVQPAPDEHRELEYVALEAKKLILHRRVPPDRIAVVARTGREDARLAHEILTGAGLPVTARIRAALAELPALRALLQLLRAAALDWPYRPLRHVLESSYFDVRVDLRAIDHLAATRRWASLDGWLEGLDRLHDATGSSRDDDPEREGFRRERIARDRAALAAFAEQARRLSDPRPAAQWLALTLELLDPGWFGFRRHICRDEGGRFDLVRLDQQGVEAAKALLGQWMAGDGDPTPVEPADWYGRIRRLLARNEIALSTPLRTGVQVLEAHEAALIPFEHTFLIHANDGEFPKAPGPGWLFTDDERRALAAAGIPLQHRALALARERALWRAVTAGGEVTVTYRTADPNGAPLLPSLMVPDHDQSTELRRTLFIWPDPFNGHHADRTALDRVIRALVADDRASAPRLLPVRLAILRGRAESVRLGNPGTGRPPGGLDPWNGALRDPRVLARLGEKFGPGRIWSASQLESWAQNPFAFLVQRVLYLDEVLEAEDEVSPLAWGGVAHRVMERFYRGLGSLVPAKWNDELAARFGEAFDAVQHELDRADSWLGLPAVWRAKRRAMRRTLEEFVQWELPRLTGWRPERFELAFGMDDAPAVTISIAELGRAPVELLLRGRIDRVDTDGRGGHRVVDYKSGEIPKREAFDDGAALQGALYLAALERLGMTPVEAAYLSLKRKQRVVVSRAECAAGLAMALRIPELVRSGRFEPAAAKSCGWRDWWPGGLALYRAQAVLTGSRFDE